MDTQDYSKVKLIVADMDGTLLNDQKQLDGAMKDVMKELARRNIMFTLASGRNVHIMKAFIEELGIILPYVTNNGATMFQASTCIYECGMDDFDLKNVCAYLCHMHIPFVAYSSNEVYILEEHPSIQSFIKRLKGKSTIHHMKHYMDLVACNIVKIVIVQNHLDLKLSAIETIHTIGEHIQCVRSEHDIYTITHTEATKGQALKKIMESFHLSYEEVMVFGDNFNDVSMFHEAKYAIAMENSCIEIKQLGTCITSSNNEQGVSTFIKTHILQPK